MSISIRKCPDSAPVVLLALVGVTCATIFSANGDREVPCSEPTSPWSHLHLLQLTIQGVRTIVMGKNLENTMDHPVTKLLDVSIV